MDKVVCIGKNYIEHAKELNRLTGETVPEKPVVFFKPPSVILQGSNHSTLQASLPTNRGSIHHECEIALRITKNCYKLSSQDAKDCFDAVTLGLDMTLRDLQTSLKKNGHPWEMGKVFKDAIILGPWIDLKSFPGFLEEEFCFSINGTIKQRAQGSKMRMNPYECLAYVSEYFEIKKGDILFTGTPEGVGPIVPGDTGNLNWGDQLTFSVKW